MTEPFEDDGTHTYHVIQVETHENGATVREETNDNFDLGYPSGYETWTLQFKDVESALKHAGVSRIGVSGVKVTVYVDGEERTR